MQENNFKIVYCRGALNANEDALSRLTTSPCAVALAGTHDLSHLRSSQFEDRTVSTVPLARQQSHILPATRNRTQHPLRCYRQLWTQLKVHDGVLCREYMPSQMELL